MTRPPSSYLGHNRELGRLNCCVYCGWLAHTGPLPPARVYKQLHVTMRHFPFPRVPVNTHSGCEDVRRLSWPVVKVMSRYVTGRHAPRDQWHGQLSDFPKLGTGHVSVRAGGKYPECMMCHRAADTHRSTPSLLALSRVSSPFSKSPEILGSVQGWNSRCSWWWPCARWRP